MSSAPTPSSDPSSNTEPAAVADTAQPPPAAPAAEANAPPPSTPSPGAQTPPPSKPSQAAQTPPPSKPSQAAQTPPPSKPSPAAQTPPPSKPSPAAQAPPPSIPSPAAQTPPASIPSPAAQTPPASLASPAAQTPPASIPSPAAQTPSPSIPSPAAQSPPPAPQRPPPSSPPPVTPVHPPPQLAPPFTSPPIAILPPPASPLQLNPSPPPPVDVPILSPIEPDVGGQTASPPPTVISVTTPPSSQRPPSTAWTTPPSPPAITPPSSTRTPTNSRTSPRNATSTSRPTPPNPLSSPPPSSQAPPVFLGITIASVAIAVVAIVFAILRKRGKNDQQRKYSPNQLSSYASPAMENSFGIYASPEAVEAGGFALEDLVSITNGFSPEHLIGKGGFGSVYKGVLADGLPVAVKQLKAGSGQGEREFQAEVETISRIHHRHLVSLVGYCIADRQRMLVYEFVSNDTLDHHLHRKELPVLDWAKRMRIAIGSARGLAYLHEDCHPRIIHRDIKSANILLDESFEAKVADFGLAKLTNDALTHVSTRVMGTFGYLAPEYASSGKLTDRSDVYSFGVVLLELITGREPIDPTLPSGDGSLVGWARPLLLRALNAGGEYEELVDPRLENNFNQREMLQMIEAAAACVRHSAPKRPRMVQVLRALDSGGSLPDLSNGVKYGESTVYNSSQYAADIQNIRKLVYESDSCSVDCDRSGEDETEGTQLLYSSGEDDETAGTKLSYSV